MRTTLIFVQLTKAFWLIVLPFLASAQTSVIYTFEIAPDGIYLIERMEKSVDGTARKQIIETPLFLRDTAGISGYLSALKQRHEELNEQIRQATAERDFLRSKTALLLGMADTMFFKPKAVIKNE